jgi:hypothetical protein
MYENVQKCTKVRKNVRKCTKVRKNVLKKKTKKSFRSRHFRLKSPTYKNFFPFWPKVADIQGRFHQRFRVRFLQNVTRKKTFV